MKAGVQTTALQLVDKYMAFLEPKVRRGVMSPLNGVERTSIELAFIWLCERYRITGK